VQIGNTGFGLIIVSVRMFDGNLRAKMFALVGVKGKQADNADLMKLSLTSAVLEANYSKKLTQIGSLGYSGIFDSLKTKFILDALTSLSLLYSIKKTSAQANSYKKSSGDSINAAKTLINAESDRENVVWYDAKTLQELFKNGDLERMYAGSEV
jgi:hypothetical protein